MPDPAQLSETIGGYVLRSVLGRGGMGVVYLGEHRLLGRKAAVKVLDGNLATDEELISRFFHEARIVNSVEHPNIVDVFDFVKVAEPARVAFVMEYLSGPNVDAWIKSGKRLPFKGVINVLLQVLSGLQTVHETGVIHRDLKPANLHFTEATPHHCSNIPSVKILDFGIAKSSDSGVSHRTQTGVLMGTPAYMAPEQVSGDPASTKTDVYAVAEIFYELLTGQRLFRGTNAEILRAKLSLDPPTVRLPPAQVHGPTIHELLTRALNFDPKVRPSVPSMIADLESLREPSLGAAPVSFSIEQKPTKLLDTPAEAPFVSNVAVSTSPNTILPDPNAPQRRGAFFWAAGLVALLAGVIMSVVAFSMFSSGPEVIEAKLQPRVVEASAIGAAPTEPPPTKPTPAAPKPDSEEETQEAPTERLAPPAPEKIKSRPAPKKRTSRAARRALARKKASKTKKRRAPAKTSEPKTTTAPATEKAPPPPAPKADTVPVGSIRITAYTTAGRKIPARVKIDGSAVASVAPMTIRAKAGRRKLVITADGYPPVKKTVVVRKGETSKLNVVVDLQ